LCDSVHFYGSESRFTISRETTFVYLLTAGVLDAMKKKLAHSHSWTDRYWQLAYICKFKSQAAVKARVNSGRCSND
jgi:hypothetical protein